MGSKKDARGNFEWPSLHQTNPPSLSKDQTLVDINLSCRSFYFKKVTIVWKYQELKLWASSCKLKTHPNLMHCFQLISTSTSPSFQTRHAPHDCPARGWPWDGRWTMDLSIGDTAGHHAISQNQGSFVMSATRLQVVILNKMDTSNQWQQCR